MAARLQPCCETNTMTESVDLAAWVHGAADLRGAVGCPSPTVPERFHRHCVFVFFRFMVGYGCWDEPHGVAGRRRSGSSRRAEGRSRWSRAGVDLDPGGVRAAAGQCSGGCSSTRSPPWIKDRL